MAFLDLLVAVVIAAVIVFTVTQIVIPIRRGTQMLPILRRERVLAATLEAERQRLTETSIEQQIAETHRETEALAAVINSEREAGEKSE